MAGKALIFSAPSGSGKTTLVKHLLSTNPNDLGFSISASTRDKRGRIEQHGKDYYFLTPEDFKQKIDTDEFIEWEEVYEGNFYGTLKSELHRMWNENKVPLLDIDVQGAIHVKQQFPDTSLSIFIEPPSIEELRRRLESRDTETAESLQARINKASYELSLKNKFDHIIINDQLERACKEAEEAVKEFLKPSKSL